MAYAERRGSTWRVRYRLPDGTWGSESGFLTQRAAEQWGDDQESDLRRGRAKDPRRGRVTIAEFVPVWRDSLRLGDRTAGSYDYLLRRFVLPRWGHVELGDITWLPVKAWANRLEDSGLAYRTVKDAVSMLSMLLQAAVDDDRLVGNPLHRRRREWGRRRAKPAERVWVTADIIGRICTPRYADNLLLRTAYWTGMRWGELAGLHRASSVLLRSNPTRHVIVVDAQRGALHELDSGQLVLGPPKPPNGAREVDLPEFLADELAAHLATWPHEHVFCGPRGGLHRRSNFSRRVLGPAVADLAPGLSFHGLRHSHKVLLLELGVPEVLQCERLGHEQSGIAGVYSHVSAVMRQRLLDDMGQRHGEVSSARAAAIG